MALRYILVNLRYIAKESDCACCKLSLGQGYTRDLSTGLVYHNPWCLEIHTSDSMKAIGGKTYVETM